MATRVTSTKLLEVMGLDDASYQHPFERIGLGNYAKRTVLKNAVVATNQGAGAYIVLEFPPPWGGEESKVPRTREGKSKKGKGKGGEGKEGGRGDQRGKGNGEGEVGGRRAEGKREGERGRILPHP